MDYFLTVLFITLLNNYIRRCGLRTPNLTYNEFYVPQPRKLVFPLQLRVKECCIFRYRGIQCRNLTAHAHIVLQWNAIFFLFFFFFSLLLRTALAPYWQSLVHLNCACLTTAQRGASGNSRNFSETVKDFFVNTS